MWVFYELIVVDEIPFNSTEYIVFINCLVFVFGVCHMREFQNNNALSRAYVHGRLAYVNTYTHDKYTCL